MTYSTNPQREKEYQAIELLAVRAIKGELGDREKALDTINRVAFTLKMNTKMVDGIIAAVRQSITKTL